MKRKPYRTALYLLARIIGFLLYPLPLRVSVKLGALMGRAAFYIIPKERRKTLDHLGAAFADKKSQEEIRETAMKVFSNLGRNAAEWLNYPKLDKRWFEKNVTTQGFERLLEAHKRKKGVIILTGHFGNWELLAAYLGLFGCKGAIIARKIYVEQFNTFFVKMRGHFGHENIYRDESPKRVLKFLRDGGYMGVLPDQDVDSLEGVFVDFFGKPAYTPTSPVKLAIKTGAALMPSLLLRTGGRFTFFVDNEIKLDITGDKERDVLVNTAKWMNVFEKYIRRYPDQWVWMHRRWKTRPKEEKTDK